MESSQFKHHETSWYDIPEFGFKIHISGTLENYKQIYYLVIPYLMSKDICFKYLESKESIIYNLSEEESPAESGKLITIYPKDRVHCKQLLEELYLLIPSENSGVYILSDRNYKDSNVIFYRYGCIKLVQNELMDGLPTLRGPNGECWQDFQKNYYDLPSWIEDLQEKQEFIPSYLGNTYQLVALLKQSNGGNVYKAKNKYSGEIVVIKECRPNILCTTTVTKNNVRENEWRLSKIIQDCIPARIEKVSEWINQYYIYDYIEGQNLLEFCNQENLFSYSQYCPENNYLHFNNIFNCITELLKTVQKLHEIGIVLNDVHPNNFIISENFKVYFIDMENSYMQHQKPLTGVYSEISLKQWNNIDGKVADCHKIGNMLLYLIGKLHVKEGDFFVKDLRKLLLQKKIDSNLDVLVDYLFTEDADIHTALEILKSKIYFRGDTTKILTLDLSNINPASYELDIIDFVLSQEEVVKNYQKKLNDRQLVLQEIKKEKYLGLNGAMGGLVYLKYIKYDNEVIKNGIQFVLDNLITIDGKFKGVRISQNAASPYLYNGTAGIIQALLYIDSEQYLKDICQLAETLTFEYAQSARFLDGMLGIAQTLLKLFALTKSYKYFENAKELLIASGILAEKDQKLQFDYICVLSQYKKLYLEVNNEIITKKQFI
ncbi:class III lanthionine synthetase LanKC N-terminal domain-containing protein [Streptococcus marmotae]|uniref:class III lanthionine synthetase LanKC N-terminal domain-containing protein n=1 Tax=Streptococcus marmotae TaxID=1825069 RepID=UPI00082C5E31|nr:kinase [Streptococcus marmotae]